MTRWVRHPDGGLEAYPDEVEGRDFWFYEGDEFASSEDYAPVGPRSVLVPNWMWWTFFALALVLWLGFALWADLPRWGVLLGTVLLIALRWRDSVLLR